MKPLAYLAAIVATLTLAACGDSKPNLKTKTANDQDRAQRLCQTAAREQHLRVSSSDEPYQIDRDHYMVNFRTRDAVGVAERRCDVDVARGRAVIL